MKKLSILLLILNLCLSQGNYTDIMKLHLADSSNQLATDFIKIGSEYYLSVVSLDTIYPNNSGNGFPMYLSHIIRTDSTANLLGKELISHDSLTNLYIQRLFPLKDPGTNEKIVGFFAYGSRIDSDSIACFLVGYVNFNTQQIVTSKLYEKRPPNYLLYAGFPLDNIISVYSDSSYNFYLILDVGQNVYSFNDKGVKRILYSFNLSQNGFALLDSIEVTNPNFPASEPASGVNYVHPHLFSIVNNPNVGILYNDTLNAIRNTYITGSNPFAFSLFSKLNPPTYLPPPYAFQLINSYISTYNDTIMLYGILNNSNINHYYYLWKFYVMGGNLYLQDSLKIYTHLYPRRVLGGNALSLSFPNAFIVLADHSENNSLYLSFTDFSWLHNSGQSNNGFTILLYNTKTMTFVDSVRLGGDAYYDVKGIYAINDKACVVYGWRFPMGNVGRSDGDAFTWFVKFNSTTTQVNKKIYIPAVYHDYIRNRIVINNNSNEFKVFLYSMTGEKVFEGVNTRIISTDMLPKGVYALIIYDTLGNINTYKLLVE